MSGRSRADDRARTAGAEEIYLDVVELDPAARSEQLRRRCGADAALRAEVDRLLLLDEGLGRFMEPDAADRADPLIGREIGDFVIQGRIGEGGFGVVYRAVQIRPVRRAVAMKVLRPGMDGPRIVARFESERQTLARMEHPGIARMLAAGSTGEGRPWLAMELVDGAPIDQFCDRERLDVPARLRLFIEVCDAVQHAHQRGVIHRDLKPSNILVSRVAGSERPLPRIIDFGIAKALASARGDDETASLGGPMAPATLEGQFIGTPEFMSPEQAAGDPGNVDSRTDIHALGVVLHLLLAGTLPLESTELRRCGLAELQKRLTEQDPPRPSSRIARLDPERRAEIAARRAMAPEQLARRVRGDLDWIVGKAMARERDRRYASASELAADVRRHLEGAPVLAGPPTLRYRLGKFIRRNRAGVAAAATVMASVLLALTVAIFSLMEAQRQRDAALESAERAQRQAYVASIAAALAALGNGDVELAHAMLEASDPVQRGWEWGHVSTRLDGSLLAVKVHDGPVRSLRPLADGALLSGGEDGRIVRIEPDGSTRELALLEGAVVTLDADAASGTILATTRSGEEPLRCYSVHSLGADGTERWRFAEAVSGPGSIDSERGSATVGLCGPRALARLALDDGREIERVEIEGSPFVIGRGGDGTVMALVSRGLNDHVTVELAADGELRTWDLELVFERATLDHEAGVVLSGAWTDGRALLTDLRARRTEAIDAAVGFYRIALAIVGDADRVAVSEANRLLLWSRSERRVVARLLGHRAEVTTASFMPEAALLASGDARGEVRLWFMPPLPLPIVVDSLSRVATISGAVAAESCVMATSGWGFVRTWDAATGELLAVGNYGNRYIDRIAIDRAGAQVALWGRDFPLAIAATSALESLRRRGDEVIGERRIQTSPYPALGWSHDGDALLFAAVAEVPEGGVDLLELDGQTLELRHREVLAAGSEGLSAAAIVALPHDLERGGASPALIACGGAGRGLLFARDGQSSVRTLVTLDAMPVALAATDDGAVAAIAGSDGSIVVVERRTGVLRWRGSVTSGDVEALAFTGDGRRLAIAMGRGRIEVRDAERGDVLAVIAHGVGEVLGIASCRDSAALLIAGRDRSFEILDGAAPSSGLAMRRAEVHRIRATVDDLYEAHVTARQVEAALRAGSMPLSEGLREAALEHVRRRGDHRSQMVSDALGELHSKRDEPSVRTALARVESIRRAGPDEWDSWDIAVALAQYRLGALAEARAALRRFLDGPAAGDSAEEAENRAAIGWPLMALIERASGDSVAAEAAWTKALPLVKERRAGSGHIAVSIYDESVEAFGAP
ncbi:MAG TPA: protein kinase [Phycisphaerales bacterium]|mgnify:CR=1 FL=1|nr:protein kinase [Phycisphaerales bacterium]HMP35897.1 protein kinase [Phycisphaerales bacterium]